MPRPKRHDLAMIEGTLSPPDELPPSHRIARITKGEGHNIYAAELPDGKSILAELEAKFRSKVYIRRGSYVIVDITALAERNNKLDGEIVNVIADEKTWKKMVYWPKEFAQKSTYAPDSDSDDEESTVGKLPPTDSDED